MSDSTEYCRCEPGLQLYCIGTDERNDERIRRGLKPECRRCLKPYAGHDGEVK
jgi:hypothetical protein